MAGLRPAECRVRLSGIIASGGLKNDRHAMTGRLGWHRLRFFIEAYCAVVCSSH
jgi:hypothetical protein